MPDGCRSGVSKVAHGAFAAGGAWGEVTSEEVCRAKRPVNGGLKPGAALHEGVSEWGLAEQGS